MPDDIVIRAGSLGKKYLIGHDLERERYTTLREVIARKVKGLARSGANGFRATMGSGQKIEEFWALREINFEIKRGEVVGIIGRNGAGKSTLLKILSRITEPSEGRVEVKGRVASLLEVGTGFHPELTGRENIYLNGSILGMARAEISRKFDEIVAFAEVERFLDTPVKRYSSGMHVRLAFSVAAHLEPEILIVDEVLAVGDAAFQEKCIGKLNTVAKSDGRTVLFVSHNMSVVQQLCKRCILLKDGQIRETGETSEVVGNYLSSSKQESNVDIRNWSDRQGSGEARIVQLTITDDAASPTSVFPLRSTVCFHLETEFYEPLVDPCFGVVIHASSGEPVLDLQSAHHGLRVGRVDGRVKIQGTFPSIGLYPGTYFVSPWITDAAVQRSIDFVRMCCSIEVIPKPGDFGDLRLDPLWGKYWVNSEWKEIDPLKTETRTHMFSAKSNGN